MIPEGYYCIPPLGRLDLDEIVTGGSAFDVKAKSLRLGDFDEADAGAALVGSRGETTRTAGAARGILVG